MSNYTLDTTGDYPVLMCNGTPVIENETSLLGFTVRLFQKLNEELECNFNDLTYYKNQADKFEGLINELRVQLDRKDDAMRVVVEQLDEEQEKVKELRAMRDDNIQIMNRNGELSRDLGTATKKIARLAQEKTRLTNSSEELEQKLNVAEADLADANLEIEEVKESRRKKAERLAVKEDEIHVLKSANANCQATIDNLKAKLAEANDHIKGLIAVNVDAYPAVPDDQPNNQPTFTAAQVAALIKNLGE